MRILFMGTPDFAVPTLDHLIQAGHEIVAVVTVPDKPAGRGKRLLPSPVKVFAEAQGLRVLQPERLRDPAFVETVTALAPDLAVVVAFRMLPRLVWSIPRLGTLNLHASLLPDYRGAAPLNWVLIHGETETGLTTFFIDDAIDTGDLLLQRRVAIPVDWTAGDLHDHMMVVGAELVVETVRQLAAGTLVPQPQDPAGFVHPAPKLFKEDGQLDWQQPAEALYHRIRGLSPYPAAWTTLEDQPLKLFRAALVEEEVPGPPGTLTVAGDRLLVACGQGALSLLELQLPGKKRLSAADFLRGYKAPLLRLS